MTPTASPKDGVPAGRRHQPRADAAKNRQHLIHAAREAFSTTADVGAVPLHAIARAAGVGQGTLYRHFPTREDLLLAVYEADVELLVSSAPHLLSDHPPRDALRRWLIQLAAYGSVKRSLGQIVQAATGDALSDRWRRPVLDALGLLLAAGQETGELRNDVDAPGVLRLCSFLWAKNPVPSERTDVGTLLAIMIDGLTTSARQPVNRRRRR